MPEPEHKMPKYSERTSFECHKVTSRRFEVQCTGDDDVEVELSRLTLLLTCSATRRRRPGRGRGSSREYHGPTTCSVVKLEVVSYAACEALQQLERMGIGTEVNQLSRSACLWYLIRVVKSVLKRYWRKELRGIGMKRNTRLKTAAQALA